MTSPRMIVFGLDGASWDFLDPWMESGDLPVLREIRDEGPAGGLESCLPPVTSPNWKCFSTGKQPGNLGVYWWEILDWGGEQVVTPRSGDYRSAELWDYLSAAGLRSLVVNMPTTYPPRTLDGTLIAGGPTCGSRGYTHPPSLETELSEEYDYRSIPENIDWIQQRPGPVIEEIRRLMKLRFRVAETLMDRGSYDYVQVTLFLINVLQHHFGHAEPVREAWRWIDRTLGEWRDRHPDVPLILVSDHGCNEIDLKFNVNEWLIREEYLAVEKPVDQTLLGSLGLNKDRVGRWLADRGLKTTLKRWLPENLRNLLPTESGAVRASGKNRLIDWEKSSAYAFGQGPLFVNPDRSADSRASLVDSLTEGLTALRGPGGTPVAHDVEYGSTLYGEHALGTPPDLVIDQAPGIHISGSIGFPDVFEEPDQWVAENAREGLYAWSGGPAVRLEAPDETVRITDLAPSILGYLIGSVPGDVDGRLRIRESDGSEPETLPSLGVPWQEETSADEDRVRDRLRGIGYLD